MDWPSRIVLVRHGQSEGNVKSEEDVSFEGRANHAFILTPEGERASAAVGRYLQTTYGFFDAYFCSTFRRTRVTHSLMFPGIKPIIDSRLNELWRGIWHTMSREKIVEIYPEEVAIRLREGEYHYRAPGGQSCPDVEGLIYSFMQSLRADYAGKDVVISAHGTWMLLFWRVICNREPEEVEERLANNRYHNSALCVYERGENGMELVADNILLSPR